MKNKLVLALLLISSSTSAQLIHVAGSKAIGLDGGYVKNGFNVSSRITLYKNNNFAYRGSIDFERVDFAISKASIIYVNPELIYNFYTLGENFFLSAKGGILSGVEFLSNSVLDKKESQFFIGENIGLCVEYYLSNKIMLNLDLDQRFFQLSKVGKASFIIRFGINYNF
jgi:opacity protein-like surface antigen